MGFDQIVAGVVQIEVVVIQIDFVEQIVVVGVVHRIIVVVIHKLMVLVGHIVVDHIVLVIVEGNLVIERIVVELQSQLL